MRRLAIALFVGLLLGYTVGRADASDSALSNPAGIPPLTPSSVTDGAEFLTGAPNDPGADQPAGLVVTSARDPSNGRRSPGQRSAQSQGSVRAMGAETAGSFGAPTPNPGTTAPPTETWTRQGIVNWAGASHGPAYLALPIGPGHRVELCGPAGCLTLVSTDAGPDRERQRAGRIADLAVGLWESISGVPRGYGGFVGTWTLAP